MISRQFWKFSRKLLFLQKITPNALWNTESRKKQNPRFPPLVNTRQYKVRLPDWGMMKLEIESEKVDDPQTFRAKKHIRGVRLHFLPQSEAGTQELYDGITFEKEK